MIERHVDDVDVLDKEELMRGGITAVVKLMDLEGTGS
jgi:hypothetical protein